MWTVIKLIINIVKMNAQALPGPRAWPSGHITLLNYLHGIDWDHKRNRV